MGSTVGSLSGTHLPPNAREVHVRSVARVVLGSAERRIFEKDGALSEWEIFIERDGVQLGLSIDPLGQEALAIQEVLEPGPVFSWNASQGDFAVRAGDCIVEVNGIRGEPEQLLQAIRQ